MKAEGCPQSNRSRKRRSPTLKNGGISFDARTFAILPSEHLNFQFRADAFNVLNHPNFSSPGTNTNYDDITQGGSFGQLTSMNGGARVLQLSGRLQF